jgi:hypothetical protein
MYKKQFMKWKRKKYGQQDANRYRSCVRRLDLRAAQLVKALQHETPADQLVEAALSELVHFMTIAVSSTTLDQHYRVGNYDVELFRAESQAVALTLGGYWMGASYNIDEGLQRLDSALRDISLHRCFQMTAELLSLCPLHHPESLGLMTRYLLVLQRLAHRFRANHPVHLLTTIILRLLRLDPSRLPHYLGAASEAYGGLLDRYSADEDATGRALPYSELLGEAMADRAPTAEVLDIYVYDASLDDALVSYFVRSDHDSANFGMVLDILRVTARLEPEAPVQAGQRPLQRVEAALRQHGANGLADELMRRRERFRAGGMP